MTSIPTPRNKFTRDLHSQGVKDLKPLYDYYTRPLKKQFSLRDPSIYGYFDHRQKFDTYYSISLEKGSPSLLEHSNTSIDSYYVFCSRTILPYIPKVFPAKVQNEIHHLYISYANQAAFRLPTLYRISDDWFIDDYGRIYDNRSGRLVWHPYNVSGKLRNNITLRNRDGTYLKRPCYFFSAIAGYHPTQQRYFAFSLKYEYHHVAENKLDLRPGSVYPLEHQVHSYVHSQDLQDPQSRFFNRNKPRLFYSLGLAFSPMAR